jgi:DNA polymerase (family X)
VDNKTIATLLNETADLLQISGEDPFRIRSYRGAAESLESLSYPVESIIEDPKKVLEIPGIGKGMLANLQELHATGELAIHQELLKKYKPSILELLRIQGLGPKTIALIWDAYKVSDLDGVAELAKEGKIRILPRMGEKAEQKILKGIEDYRRISGRFLIDAAADTAAQLIKHLHGMDGVETITPAGSLRRGRETVGDLDVLITGPCCVADPKPPQRKQRDAVVECILSFPGIDQVLARGENKLSFKLRSGMQVDVRLLAPESFGAALLYFTGSKSHNVVLRQRALKMGYTLNEYGLAKLAKPKDGDDSKRAAGKIVASKTEQDIYQKLGLVYIEPELRENLGEIEAAESGSLPKLISEKDIQGDVHMHTVATDGKCSIEEMAEAARKRGYKYIAITDHSKNLAMANGLDDVRAEAHIQKIRKVAKKFDDIKVLSGIEVDILADGELDLSDGVLAQMDVVIASVHSHFNQEPAKMTERLLAAIGNPNVSILGHPTGRLLLRREAYAFDMDAILKAAAKKKLAMELNAFPDRLDLCDRDLRMARDLGVKIVINTDSHHTSHLDKMRFGVLQARRAWLTRADVLNSLPPDKFLHSLQSRR